MSSVQEPFYGRRGRARDAEERHRLRAIEDAERTARTPRLRAEIAALRGESDPDPLPAPLLSVQPPIAQHATPATAAASNELPPAGPVGTTVPDVHERSGHLSLPNRYFDELMPSLTPDEFKVLTYIIRRTRGWHKEEDTISLRQFATGIAHKDGGTGMARKTIQRALKSLAVKGHIVVTQHISAAGDPDMNSYRAVL